MSGDAPRYQMFWNCAYCGAEKLLGVSHRYCPNCGAVQNPDDRYFPPEDEKVALEDHEFIGADVQCLVCDTPNSAKVSFCINCGANMSDGTKVKLVHESDKEDVAPPSPPKKSNPIPLMVGGLIGVIAICCGVLNFWTSSSAMTVKGHAWERSILIEVYKEIQESDWKGSVPSKATDVQCRKKKKSTKKVADGEECKTVKKDDGDGSYREEQTCKTVYKEVPVYGQYCSYDIEKWTTDRTEKENGLDLSPRWPVVDIKPCTLVRLGCKRTGKKTQTYTVQFHNVEENEDYQCDFSESVWKTYALGSEWTADVNMLGSVKCDSLQPLSK